ncbi:MAG: T9SS type A sorting domain-containing protein [Bacteroidetes bacterium]|nr:T9SS type A sorting domain-containing protein [Bacteroidota bacterium]
MKKIPFLLIFFLSIRLCIVAQIPYYNDFYAIKSHYDAYFDSLRTGNGDAFVDNDESGYQNYQAWVHRWKDIVYPCGGDLSILRESINRSIQTPINNYSASRTTSNSSLNSNWTEMGPTVQPIEQSSALQVGSPLGGTGRIDFIVVDPNNNNHLIAGSPAGGLFYSSNGGATWVNANTDKLPVIGMSCAAVDPTNSNNWFAATGDKTAFPLSPEWDADGWNVSIGLYRSTANIPAFNWELIGGASKLNPSNLQHWQIKKILINPFDPNIIYLATTFGIYYTSNALATPASSVSWSLIPNTDDGTGTDNNNLGNSFDDIEFIGTSATTFTLYACRDYNPNVSNSTARILSIIPSGSLWSSSFFDSPILTTVTGITRMTIETSAANPVTLYALTTGSPTSHLFIVNTATSALWGDMGTISVGDYNSNGVGASCIKSLCVSPINTNPNILYGDTYPIFHSNNYSSWIRNSASSPTHNDIRGITYSSDGSTLYAGTDGGVWKSTDDGLNWTATNNGLGVGTIYGFAGSETKDNVYMSGNQDCGTNFYDGTDWFHVLGGDGMAAMINYKDPAYVYGTVYGGDVYGSHDGGQTFSLYSQGNGSDWMTFEVMNSSDPTVYYQTGTEVSRIVTNSTGVVSQDLISNFAQHNGLISGHYKVYELFTAPSNPDYLYAKIDGLVGPKLFKTINANDAATNVVWAEIPYPTNINASIISVAVDANDPENIWAVFGGFNNVPSFIDKKIWNYNGNTHTWTNITNGLPDYAVQSIISEKGSDGGLYIATNGGVFYTNNKFILSNPTNSWQAFNTGLPNVSANPIGFARTMEINYKSNTISLGTFGRGVWESQLACPVSTDITDNTVHASDAFLEAANTIYSTATDISNNLTYRAGSEIDLQSGFHVAGGAGASFHGFIHGCSGPGNSFRRAASHQKPSEGEQITFNTNLPVKNESFAVQVVPNPNTGIFELRLSNSKGVDISVQITDLSGRVLQEIKHIEGQVVTMNLNGYQSGVYLIKIDSQNGQIFKKVVIQN